MGDNPVDIDKVRDYTVENNSLLLIYDPVDDIRVDIGCFKLVTYYVVRHSVKCLTESERQDTHIVCIAIKCSRPVVLALDEGLSCITSSLVRKLVMVFFKCFDISNVKINLSNNLIMLVRDIGLSSVHLFTAVSLGIGVIFASFHKDGTFCCSSEMIENCGNALSEMAYQIFPHPILKLVRTCSSSFRER